MTEEQSKWLDGIEARHKSVMEPGPHQHAEGVLIREDVPALCAALRESLAREGAMKAVVEAARTAWDLWPEEPGEATDAMPLLGDRLAALDATEGKG